MGLDGTPRLVGRQPELELVDDMLARARTGVAVLVLRGEPGIGATRLLQEACARGTAAGFHLARTGTSPLETDLGYAVLHRLLRPLLGGPGARAALVDGLPALAAVLPSLGPAPAAGDGAVDGLRVGESVRVVLERLSRRGPLLLGVDDAEDADTASLAVLLHVLRTPDDLRLALVLTAHTRAGEAGRDGAADLLVRAVRALPSAVVHDVGPLDAAGVRAMVSDLLAEDPSAEVLEHVVSQVQGSPLLLRGVVGSLLASGALVRERGRWQLRTDGSTDVRAPERAAGLPELVQRRLDRLGPHGQAATSLIALAGGRLEHVALVRALREVDPEADPEDTVADVAATALVAEEPTPRLTYRLTHPVLVEAAAARPSPVERRRGHAALARALSDAAPEDLDRPALQAALAGDLLQDTWAVHLILRAMRSALGRGTGETALRHAEAGLQRDSAVDAEVVAELLRGRAFALELTGSTDAALEAWDEVAVLCARGQRVAGHVEAVRHLARLEAWNGRPRRALARIEALRASPLWARSGADQRVQVLDLATGIAQRLRTGEGELLDDLSSAAREAGTPDALRRAALRRVHDLHDRGELTRATLLAAGLDRSDPELVRGLAILEMEWGDPHEAVRMLETCRDTLPSDPVPRDALRLDEVRLLALARCDRFDDVLTEMGQVLRLADRLGAGRSAAYAVLARGQVHVHRGSLDLARADLRTARTAYPALDGTDRHMTGYADLLQAWLDLASGRPEAVVDRATRRDVLGRFGGTDFISAGNLTLGLALRRTGDVDALEQLARSLVERVPDHPSGHAVVERVAGWVAAEQGRHAEAAALLARSADRLEGLRLLREAACARLDAAELAVPAADASSVQQALEVLEGLGCAPEARRARRLLRRAGRHAPRRRAGDLTERELQVARLVAEGLSDAEIARRLVVSPRTVTTHLQHAYRRLGLSGRTALARHVLERRDT